MINSTVDREQLLTLINALPDELNSSCIIDDEKFIFYPNEIKFDNVQILSYSRFTILMCQIATFYDICYIITIQFLYE